MRATVHLVTARDCLTLRPLVRPVIDRSIVQAMGGRMPGVDTAAARAMVAECAQTADALGKRLADRFPGCDAEALSIAVRGALPLVQLPPRGIWGKGGLPKYATAAEWIGQPLAANPSIDDLVLRYLAAYGPATVADIQNWSGLTRLNPVVDRLLPRLVTFTTEDGTVLYDLPDAPRPDPDTPAPVRFLPEYDNALLGHADRSRIIAKDDIPRIFTRGAVLADGSVVASWTIKRAKGTATLAITPFRPLADIAAIEAEGLRLLAFAVPRKPSAIQFIKA